MTTPQQSYQILKAIIHLRDFLPPNLNWLGKPDKNCFFYILSFFLAGGGGVEQAMNNNVCNNQFLPTSMFSWVLSLILNPPKTVPIAQRQGKQEPSPILEEISQSKYSSQKKPMKPALKKGGICLAYNIQCKHQMHVVLVAKYDFDTLLNLCSSIFADGFFYHRKHSIDRSLSGHLPAERTREL